MTKKVFVRESDPGAKLVWRQYLVIGDNSVHIVDMVPALWSDWNFGKITHQGDADWCGQTAEQIVAWKEQAYPGDLKLVSTQTAAQVLAKVTGKEEQK